MSHKAKRKPSTKNNQVAQATTQQRGVQKKVASPIATGARGVTFEHRVQAVRLLAMCMDMPCAGVPDNFSIVKITFQGRVHGHNTDDLVLCVASPNGDTGTIRMQMKRSLVPTSKNAIFEEAIGLAWLDFNQPTFRSGSDANLIVYQSASAKSMEAAVEVSNLANTSSDAESWHTKVHTENFSNARNREAYAAIKAAAELYNKGPIAADDLYHFVVHLKFLHHDLDSDSTSEVAHQKGILAIAAVPNSETAHVWGHLVHACAALNGLGGDLDLATVGRHIGEQLERQFRTSRLIRKQQTPVHLTFGKYGPEDSALVPPPAGTMFGGGVFTHKQQSGYFDNAPPARPSSIHKYISRNLDNINEMQRAYRYADALEQLRVQGQDMKDFDDHQRARWHLLRGMCRWHLEDNVKNAADDFLRAASLCDDDDKLAAARVRGYMLKGEIAEALVAGSEAADRFPESLAVWVAATNARILNGERFTVADIPPEHAEQAVAWQVIATSQEQAGDLSGAIQTCRAALMKEDASFFIKETFLRCALQLATENDLNIGFRMLTPEQRTLLSEGVELFSNRSESLWTIQNKRAQVATLTHLGYAYLLMGKPQDTITIIGDARAHGAAEDKSLYQLEIEALRDLGRADDALTRFAPLLRQLSDEGLVAFGQTAVMTEDVEKLDLALMEGQRRGTSLNATRLNRILRLMRWDVLIKKNRAQDLRGELDAAAIDSTSTSIAELIFAARAHRAPGGENKLAEEYIDRIASLSSGDIEVGEAYLAAQFLLQSERYAAAAELYTKILPVNSFSELHTNLLYCYLRMGHRAKARELLQTMPPVWKQSRNARHMAVDLGQAAGDWELVAQLAKVEIAENPKAATAWLLRLVATANTERAKVPAVIEEIPIDLSGSIQDLARLASAEIQNGHVFKGLQRLYKLRRCHMGSTEAAALHVISILATSFSEQALDDVPEEVGPSAAVVLSDANGIQRRLTIDPEGFEGLPSTDEFVPPEAPEAVRLKGLRLNDSIEIVGLFGEVRRYTVTQIYSAHRRLLETSHSGLHSTLNPSKYMAAMSLPSTEDGKPDLTIIQRQLESRADYAMQVLDLYKQHPAPLGIIAHRLGCDAIDIVRGWPISGPKLEIGDGLPSTRQAGREMLKVENLWLIDSTLLAELASIGHLEVLKALPKVIVSAATRDLVARKLEESAVFRQSGAMFYHDGRIGFHEKTKEEWQHERAFLLDIEKAIQDYCSVLPAYGPEIVDLALFRMNEVLSAEEYSALLLCLEHKASLLTLDNRFRKLALMYGIKSAQIQELLYHMVIKKQIRDIDYSEAILKMVFWGRTFVSLNVQTLIAMMGKGLPWVNTGINNLRAYLCDPTVTFNSAALVIRDFIGQLYATGNCQLGVVIELIEYLVEALLRHKDCPAGWAPSYTLYLWNALGFTSAHQSQCIYVAEAVRRAAARTEQQFQPVTVKATVTHFLGMPMFISGDIANTDSGLNVPTQANDSNSSEQGSLGISAVEDSRDGPLEL